MLTRLVTAGRRAAPVAASLVLLLAALPALGAIQAEEAIGLAAADGHLVISELQTGGAGASDEFVELYNPTDAALPLEGLELVYVTASGATVTRKASWALGAPSVPAGAHVLVSNEAGIYAAIGDLTYASGVAATGGAWALRIQGASTALDSVGWGTGAAWLEGRAAPAPASGSSLERLPGGSSGSTQDTDDNLVDFAIRDVPEPQNQSSPVVPDPTSSASGTASPTPTVLASPSLAATPTPIGTGTPAATPSPTPSPSPTPTATPSPPPAPITIAAARALPDGTRARIRATAVTASDFGDGGGYLADATGGIAVLVTGASFERGQVVEVAGELDDRYAQRTLRADATDLMVVGSGSEPVAGAVVSGAIDESLEGQLVELDATLATGPSPLSGGQAFDVDDGSGSVRVFVSDATAIDLAAWEAGTRLHLRGVVGQRDSSGTGTAGYRVQPRDAADILSLDTPAPPTPTATPSASSTPLESPPPSQTASPSPSTKELPVVSIADARAGATGMRLRVRGVVTLPSDLVEPGSAVIQDPSGAILLRLSDEAGSIGLGELVEVTGTRSTKAGMLTLRVTDAVRHLGSQPEPSAVRMATGAAGEDREAQLVIVRGAVTGNVSRSSSGGTSFEIDDGSGPVRIAFAGRASLGAAPAKGSWIEVRGPLGQETTGAQPQRGYRVWPRRASDVVLVAAGAQAATGSVSDGGEDGEPSGDRPGSGASPSLGSRTPRLGEAVPSRSFGTLAPGLATGPGDTDGTGASIRPASASTDPAEEPKSLAAGLLLIGLGGLLASGTTAVRGGLVGRLWPPSGRRPAAADDTDPGLAPQEEVGLTRLSVVGGSRPEPG